MAIPTNLIPVNASSIPQNAQTLLGEIPQIPEVPNIPDAGILNIAIPDSTFQTGSLDEIKKNALDKAQVFVKGFPALPSIPSLPTELLALVTLPAPPPIPSYGQIKNFIKTKIDRIKAQKQKASVKALKEDLKRQQNPFEYRKNLKNTQLANISRQIINNRG